jgi:hypothetical protein
MTICKKCKKEYELVGSWCGHDISDEFGDYFSLSYEDKGVEFCGECAKKLATKVKYHMNTLVETKKRIVTTTERDSFRNVKYNCPYCNYEHWHEDYTTGCPHKFCSECGGKYE